MRTCEYCGGNADSGSGATNDGKSHYSRIACAEVLREKLAASDGHVRALVELLVKRRAMEPRHSEEMHECDECTVLAEMGRNRHGFVAL